MKVGNKNWKTLSLTSVLTLGLALAGASAWAGGDKAHKDKSAKAEKKMNPQEKMAKQSREVSGTVVAKKMVRLPTENLQNMVVMIKTNKADERLLVDLGNAKALNDKKIDKQTNIQAEGRLAQVGQHRILVARNLKVEGEKVTIDRSQERQAAMKARGQQGS